MTELHSGTANKKKKKRTQRFDTKIARDVYDKSKSRGFEDSLLRAACFLITATKTIKSPKPPRLINDSQLRKNLLTVNRQINVNLPANRH